MSIQALQENIKRLSDLTEDKSLHLLDRVEAKLELAMLLHRDTTKAWRLVREAKEMLRDY